MAADKNGGTVTVGCKLPHGLHLDLYNPDGTLRERVTVAGLNSSDLIGGHGITMGVSKAHFDEWMRRNKDSAAVRNELVFAHENAADTAAQSRSNAKNKSGFEAINADMPDESGKIKKDDGKK